MPSKRISLVFLSDLPSIYRSSISLSVSCLEQQRDIEREWWSVRKTRERMKRRDCKKKGGETEEISLFFFQIRKTRSQSAVWGGAEEGNDWGGQELSFFFALTCLWKAAFDWLNDEALDLPPEATLLPERKTERRKRKREDRLSPHDDGEEKNNGRRWEKKKQKKEKEGRRTKIGTEEERERRRNQEVKRERELKKKNRKTKKKREEEI